MRQSIQEWTSKICGRQSLKNVTWSILEILENALFVNFEKTDDKIFHILHFCLIYKNKFYKVLRKDQLKSFQWCT